MEWLGVQEFMIVLAKQTNEMFVADETDGIFQSATIKTVMTGEQKN